MGGEPRSSLLRPEHRGGELASSQEDLAWRCCVDAAECLHVATSTMFKPFQRHRVALQPAFGATLKF